MEAWLAGLLGGVVGAVAFTVVVMPFMAGMPLASTLLIARVTGRSGDYGPIRIPGLAGHLAYGAVTGLAFGVVAIDALDWTAYLWAWGALYGIALQAVAIIAWGPLIRMSSLMNDLPPDTRTRLVVAMVVGHFVYGLLAGTLVEALAR